VIPAANLTENILAFYEIYCSVLSTSAAPAVKVFYRDANKSLAQPGRKQATATEDFDFHISYL
jgi:hypothetical protein